MTKQQNYLTIFFIRPFNFKKWAIATEVRRRRRSSHLSDKDFECDFSHFKSIILPCGRDNVFHLSFFMHVTNNQLSDKFNNGGGLLLSVLLLEFLSIFLCFCLIIIMFIYYMIKYVLFVNIFKLFFYIICLTWLEEVSLARLKGLVGGTYWSLSLSSSTGIQV